jgi:putative flavoprotein involved in K+ transport
MTPELDVLVVGAGQAGLAMGRYLQQQDARFLIVDAGTRVGDVWRSRWDSLRLFTAAEHDGLPGLPFPAPAGSYPGKDDVAGYLETYVRTFGLPVQLDTRVTRLSRSGDGAFTADTTGGPITARQVVVATGPVAAPRIPALATGLAPDVVSVHSSAYRRPEQLPEGRVLVVGAGNSGVQIAEELAASGRAVSLAVGSRPRTVPQRPLGRDLFWWLTRTGLIRASVDSRLGRRFRDRELVIGTTWKALQARGVDLLPRAVSAAGRTVTLAGGGTTDVDAVVWATGFSADHGWLDLPGAVVDGVPAHRRGVSPVPGLFFLGLPWQHTRGSALLGFVRHDATWIAEQVQQATTPVVEQGDVGARVETGRMRA